MDESLQFINTMWEGVFTADFTLEQVRKRCSNLSHVLKEQGASCLIGYDTRFMSDLIAQDIYHMLELCGIPTHLSAGPVPLPAVHHALGQHQADCALVVSARNKPYWYNGLVLLKPNTDDSYPLLSEVAPDQSEAAGAGEVDEANIADDTSPIASSIETEPFPHQSPTVASLESSGPAIINLRKPYVDMLIQQVDVGVIRRVTMTIFVDAMHGTMAGYLPAIIGEDTQTMAIEINRETDPLFNKLTPSPALSELNRLRKLVRESDSNVGLAYSADGTALGIVDKNGELLTHLEIALLLAAYLVRQYRQQGVVIAPLASVSQHVTPTGLQKWQDSVGVRLELVENPTERITAALSDDSMKVLVGCNKEGALVLGNYKPYSDALLASLLFIELVARNGGNLRNLLDELRATLATPSSQ